MHFYIQTICSNTMKLNNINLKTYELKHIEIIKLLFSTFPLNFEISSLPKLHLIHDLQT